MKKIISICLYLTILNCSHIYCKQTSDKSETTGLSLFAGCGTLFGGETIPGIGGEYNFFNNGHHHLACIGGGGYRIADKESGWSAGGRYGIGGKDRFILDLLYGSQGYDGYSDPDSGKFTTKKKYYGPSLLVGYQRITPNGFEFASAIGMDHTMALRVSVLLGYKIW